MSIKAVILAAGRGVRLQGFSGEKPKSLLEIGPVSLSDSSPTTFLERQINCLRQSGVNDIAVVIGYNKEQIIRLLKGKDITLIENTHPDLSESGSLHSFQFAKNSPFNPLDGQSHTLLMDADIAYEVRILKEYIDSLKSTSVLISGFINKDSEEVRVYGPTDKPLFIGKGYTPRLVDNLPCLGEAVGIVHFAPEDHVLVSEITDWLLGNPKAEPGSLQYKGFGSAKIGTEHEILTQQLMMLGKIRAQVVDPEKLFMEVDQVSEYKTLTEQIYPKILLADQEYLAHA